jgi:tetratricopeptide (TPR) repeat protein
MEYRDSPKNLRQIGEELNARYLLEGGVQRAGGTVRINVQLIDSDTDEHVFAETYDWELSLENLLAVQREVALRIADALEATLTTQERERVEQTPTGNLEAYDYYLRGNDYFGRGWAEEDLRIAARMYERAIELDSSFALAYSRLSQTHSEMYWYYYDWSDARLAAARQAADRALRLQPDLPEAHVALGFYHYRVRDYEHALEEFALGQKDQPNSSDIVSGIGVVERRRGRWAEALRSLVRGVELDPRSAEKVHWVGSTLYYTRDYAEAERSFERATALQPEWGQPRLYRAWLRLSRDGSAGEARAILKEAWDDIAPSPVMTWIDDVQPWHMLRSLEPDARDTLWLLAAPFFGPDTVSYYLARAELFGRLDDVQRQTAYYDSARVMLEAGMATRLPEAERHSLLGVAYAGLGRVGEAVQQAQTAVEQLSVSEDGLWGRAIQENLAWIYVAAGEHDAAVDRLEFLLSIPGPLTAVLLRIDPAWDPLRDHPRFQALLEEYE